MPVLEFLLLLFGGSLFVLVALLVSSSHRGMSIDLGQARLPQVNARSGRKQPFGTPVQKRDGKGRALCRGSGDVAHS